jgi:hypothetical protein
MNIGVNGGCDIPEKAFGTYILNWDVSYASLSEMMREILNQKYKYYFHSPKFSTV